MADNIQEVSAANFFPSAIPRRKYLNLQNCNLNMERRLPLNITCCLLLRGQMCHIWGLKLDLLTDPFLVFDLRTSFQEN